MRTAKVRPKRRKIRVGDRVRITLGLSTTLLEVVEDRGNLGVGGRQIVRVRELGPYSDPDSTYEVRADDVTIVRRAPTGSRRRNDRPGKALGRAR